MRARTSVLLETLRVQLWVVPTIAAAIAVVIALVMIWADRASGSLGLPMDVNADSARAILSTIAGAMISFTALVFSVTMLVLQQASNQLSPRVTRTFLRDRFNHVVLGTFVAAFVYALLMLAAVDESDVPRLGVIVALVLVLAAIIAFVAYLDHMAHAIRASSVIEAIADETRGVIERLYAEAGSDDAEGRDVHAVDRPQVDRPDPGAGTRVVWSGRSGYIQAVDEGRLSELAAEREHDLRLVFGVGSFLVRDAVVLRIDDKGDAAIDDSELGCAGAVRVGAERSMAVDPEFGFRQLVDVALRALSPSINDPSTAGQVIDRLHELLHQLRSCSIRSPRVVVSDDGPAVVVPAPDWDAYVHLAVDEIALAARTMPTVREHLRAVIEELLEGADGDKVPALRTALASIADPSASAARR